MVQRMRAGRGAATRSKVTVTIPFDVLQAAMRNVENGGAPSLSAYVSAALADKVERDQGRSAYREWLKQLDEELGPPSVEDYAWARDILGR